MTKLHKTFKKIIPKETRTPLDRKIGDENIKTHESLERRMSPELPPEEAAVPMPDEEEIKRNKRRNQAARSGGRASTILTGGDKEALGG